MIIMEEEFLNSFCRLLDCELYKSELDAFVLTWMEVINGRAVFQKRIYKDISKLRSYVYKLFLTRSDSISNVQFKACYKFK